MKLESDKSWKTAMVIADAISTSLDHFPEEEQWTIVSKLRSRIFDLTSDIAEAAGILDPRDKVYHYGLARRDIFSIKNALIMADKSGSLELDQALMRKLDGLGEAVDAAIDDNDKHIQPYLKKFSLQENPQ